MVLTHLLCYTAFARHVGHSARQNAQAKNQVATTGELRFLKPSMRRHLPTANQVSERVLIDRRPRSLALSSDSPARHGVPFLNQACNHLPRRMVLIKYARDLDLHDRSQTRRRLHEQARTSNQLPVNSAGNSQSTNQRRRQNACEPHVGMRALRLDARAPIPQKEDQCQES